MRNKTFRDDQKVFAYINSKDCKSLRDLYDYLIENCLPLKERWVFYYYGKHNWIDDETIVDIEVDSPMSYGGYIRGETYYWKIYLDNKEKHLKDIKEELEEDGDFEKATDNYLNELLIKRGWDYVYDCIDADRSTESFNDNAYGIEYDRIGNTYCDACQSSPCTCSDREKTSTVHDF